MRRLWMSNLAKFLSGILIGAVGLYAFGPEKIVIEKQTERIEIPVEKVVVKEIKVPVVETRTVVKEIKVPQIIEKVIIKEIEVPTIVEKPIIQHINTTRVIYKPIKQNELDDIKQLVKPEEVQCLALNIYREANNQSIAGQIAVGRVVMNRVLDRRYPPDTCGVIFEGPVYESWKTKKQKDLPDEERVYYPRRDRCQFSWYCDGKKDELINKENNRAWKTAENIAFQILAYDKWNGVLEGATHYHADYVSPKWRHALQKITKIDDHIFYKRS